MNRSRIAVGAVSIIGLVALAPVALAHNGVDHDLETVTVEATVGASANVGGVNVNANARASTTGSSNSNAGGSSTSTTVRNDDDSDDESGDDRGVSAEVRALLRAADRDGGIGAEVREIAQAHASSSARVETAKERIDRRPSWLRFILGAGFKNLGDLRSEITTTKNHIDRLVKARDRAVDASASAELTAQIGVLEAQASTTADFVADHESEFSLFGWVGRLVN